MATRQTTEYLNSTNDYRTGQRFGGTHVHTRQLSFKCVCHWLCFPSTSCRSVITCGGTHLLQSFLKMTPCWPLLSVWKTGPNVTVRISHGNTLLPSHSFLSNAHCLFHSSSEAIGRTLIPRYFRSIFEGGATELYYVLKHPKESFHNNFVSLDCDQCTMVTQNGKPMFTQVCLRLAYTRNRLFNLGFLNGSNAHNFTQLVVKASLLVLLHGIKCLHLLTRHMQATW